MSTNVAVDDRLLRMPEVEALTGVHRTTIYRMIRQKRFPASCRITGRARGWTASSVQNWMKALQTN